MKIKLLIVICVHLFVFGCLSDTTISDAPATTEAQQKKLNSDFLNATENGDLQAIEQYLERGASINATNERGFTALLLASGNGNLNITKYLIDHGANINAVNENEWTALHRSSSNGHFDVTKNLVEHGANLHAVTDFGSTPLHLSADNLNITKYLIEHGVNINATDLSGSTALHESSRKGHFDVTKYLVDHGIAIDAVDIDGNTALIHSSYYGENFNVTKYLVDHGSDTNATNYSEWNPLLYSTRRGDLESVKYLIVHGAFIDAMGFNHGFTALHIACEKGHLNVVEYLLAAGANANIRDLNRQSVLETARKNGNPRIVDLMERHMLIYRPASEACKSYSLLPVNYIIFGQLAESEEFPWMAALGYISNAGVQFDCGGTIISAYFVLTAAHCTRRRRPLIVRVGKISLTDTSDDRASNYRIKNVTEHPQYSPSRKKNDIALIRVTKRIDFTDYVKPACLQIESHDISPDVKLTVSGWGSTSTEYLQRSNELRKTQQFTVPLEECNATYFNIPGRALLRQFADGLSESQYCASDPVNHSDSCQGDSGGPLQYFPTPNSLAHIVGVVSFGIGCGGLPGIYTRVASYIDWIESIMWQTGFDNN